jgi:iron(III) transport system substrate-binding protein
VWFGGPDSIFERASREGLLAPYRPSWAESVPPSSRDPEARFFGVYRTIPVLIYAASRVSEQEAPSRWEELFSPRWKGRLLLRDPLASGVMRTVFAFLVAEARTSGADEEQALARLARLDLQVKEYVATPSLLFEKLFRGEGDVSFWELTDVLLYQSRGFAVGFVLPQDGTPVIDDAVALVRGGPNPEGGKRFVEFVGSRQAALLALEKAFRLPARSDLDPASFPPWAQRVLSELKVAAYDEALAAAEGPAWLGRFDREIRGRGGEFLARLGLPER